MDFTGFNKTYPANRPLTENERGRQLLLNSRLNILECDDLSTIRLNSIYIELVDKWFFWRGLPSMTAIVFSSMLVWMLFSWLGHLAENPERAAEAWPWFLLVCAVFAPVFAMMAWAIRKDGFRHTHYPIRLNRITQTVHVFRTDGTVLSAPWKDIFFCIASLPQNNWEIQGHVLDRDGITVEETFAFPATGTGSADRDQLPRYWEFVRRYMEDGPQSVSHHVQYCLPISDQRESFTFGFHRMHSWAAAAPFPIMIGMLMIYLGSYPGRWLAMHTSKLPVWPKEVEESCVIEPDDPYRKDASTNQPITDHSLIYLVAACGIALLAWVWW